MKNDIISPQVSTRFFFALEQLITKGDLSCVSEFCKRYDINERLAYYQRKDPERNILKTAWLSYIVRDYNVSAEWLLLGEGPMMREKSEKDRLRANTVQTIKGLLDTLL